ncbi:hypothetical protein DEVEQU_00470 [Devosia equisanguinis]|uniref:Uncharacterized protein n=1 Tax=Devosia equisanguinis TaxID=2490941 RepID=A0A3S4C9Q5_9HYPH|nr:hypothetical protein [Devosia equisanguinis]VDS03349.1 hypothetical protein DEVEQU_00470 [Devosia equisanguinis]
MRSFLAMMTIAVLPISAPAHGQGYVPFIPPTVPSGFQGTPFRGIALGQTREQVNDVLRSIGRRCATDEDFAALPRGLGGGLVIADQPLQPCWIVPPSATTQDEITGILMGAIVLGLEMRLPFNAVSFVEDRAAAIAVEPEFFDATGMAAYDFAKGIVDNYPIPDGFSFNAEGWRGFSNKNESVVVQTFNQGRYAVLVVMMNAAGNGPSFN